MLTNKKDLKIKNDHKNGLNQLFALRVKVVMKFPYLMKTILYLQDNKLLIYYNLKITINRI